MLNSTIPSIMKVSHSFNTATVFDSVTEPALVIANKVREALKNLDGWQSSSDHQIIFRDFILDDFRSAVQMIEKIANIAEEEKHHPDLHLTQYRNLRVSLTTHDLGGISEKDLTVAKQINERLLPFKNAHPQEVLQHMLQHNARLNASRCFAPASRNPSEYQQKSQTSSRPLASMRNSGKQKSPRAQSGENKSSSRVTSKPSRITKLEKKTAKPSTITKSKS